jgi:hypothetical protein
MGYTPMVVGHQHSMSSQVNPTQSIEEYDLGNMPITLATPQGLLSTNPEQLIIPLISVMLNLVHRGVSSQVNPTQFIEDYDLENIPTACAAPQGSLGTSLVYRHRSTRLSPSRSTTWRMSHEAATINTPS